MRLAFVVVSGVLALWTLGLMVVATVAALVFNREATPLWTFFVAWAGMLLFPFHLVFTDEVPHDKKRLWAAVLFFAFVFAHSVYWYWYIWRPFRRSGRKPNPAP